MKVTVIYYCSECDTTIEKFTESNDGKINFAALDKTIPCRKTSKCREMRLTNMCIPDNMKTNAKTRFDG